jgi:hypothetical protein
MKTEAATVVKERIEDQLLSKTQESKSHGILCVLRELLPEENCV